MNGHFMQHCEAAQSLYVHLCLFFCVRVCERFTAVQEQRSPLHRRAQANALHTHNSKIQYLLPAQHHFADQEE